MFLQWFVKASILPFLPVLRTLCCVLDRTWRSWKLVFSAGCWVCPICYKFIPNLLFSPAIAGWCTLRPFFQWFIRCFKGGHWWGRSLMVFLMRFVLLKFQTLRTVVGNVHYYFWGSWWSIWFGWRTLPRFQKFDQ